MHYCNDCRREASGGHKEHTENPLFLSYNMMLVVMRENPHIRILLNRHFRERQEFKLLHPNIKFHQNPYKKKFWHEKKHVPQK